MGEAAGGRDGLPVRLPADRHLEDEPVALLQIHVRRAREVGTDIGPVDRLFACDPAAPRHPPAGAVVLGAVEAGECLDDLPVLGYLDRRGAASSPAVVGRAGPECSGDGPVDLVVANQPNLPGRAAKRGHAVVTARQDGAVVEDDGRLHLWRRRCRKQGVGVVERPVLETSGKVQADDTVPQVCHRPKLLRSRFRRRCRGDQRLE